MGYQGLREFTEQVQLDGVSEVTTSGPLDVSGFATVSVQVAGITDATVAFQCSIDGTNYEGFAMRDSDSTTTTARVNFTTTDGIFSANTDGIRWFRTKCSVYTSGTITTTVIAKT